MWHTSSGDRTLQGAEAALIRAAIASVADMLIGEIDDEADHWAYGIPAFDTLSSPQRFALLWEVGEALLRPEVAMPELTAVREATVAALYTAIREEIDLEMDAEVSESSADYDTRCWRRLTLAAARERAGDTASSAVVAGLPRPDCQDEEEWDLVIDSLASGVLWDADWMDEDLFLDIDPEHAAAIKRVMNIAGDYFTAISPDPGEQELRDIRANLRALATA